MAPSQHIRVVNIYGFTITWVWVSRAILGRVPFAGMLATLSCGAVASLLYCNGVFTLGLSMIGFSMYEGDGPHVALTVLPRTALV